MVPENIHAPTTEGHWKFQGRVGGGILKAKNFKGKYEPKLVFPEGWGVQTQKSMDIFWNDTFNMHEVYHNTKLFCLIAVLELSLV